MLNNEFVAGDCGPGAVVVVVNLMCELFPLYFDRAKVPKYPVEVRCLLAVLLWNSSLFDAHFESIDPLFATPRSGTLFSGVVQSRVFKPIEMEKSHSVAWRKRLASLVCPGEGTRAPDGRRCVDSRQIVWFTLDVILTLVEYLLRQAFMGDPVHFNIWRDKHGQACHSMGPICYVPGTAPWIVRSDEVLSAKPYDPYAICVLHVSTHFQVHVRRTPYSYAQAVACTCPYLDDPSRYNFMYLRPPQRYRMHMFNPEEVAMPYLAQCDTLVLVSNLRFTAFSPNVADQLLNHVLNFPLLLADNYRNPDSVDWRMPFIPSNVASLPIQRRFAQSFSLLSSRITILAPRVLSQRVGILCGLSPVPVVLLAYTVGRTFLVRAMYQVNKATKNEVDLSLVTSNSLDLSLVPLSVRLPFAIEVATTLARTSVIGTPTVAASVPSLFGEYQYREPVEAVELAIVARDVPPNVSPTDQVFGDFPMHLPAFDVLVHGHFPRGGRQPGIIVSDDNFALAFRPRLSLQEMQSLVIRSDQSLLVALPVLREEGSSILATGRSTILGGGAGLFVFDDDVLPDQLEYVGVKGDIVGWFALQVIGSEDLFEVSDNAIVELLFVDGPRYFYMDSSVSMVRCVWDPDPCFHNNCSWVDEGSLIGVRVEFPLFNGQECFLPLGWTYGITQNQSPFICFQIWQGHQETILGTSSPFHHRLAWLLTADFINPTPRRRMQKSWGLPSYPPKEVLVSLTTYRMWLETLQVLPSLELSCLGGSSSIPSQTPRPTTSGVSISGCRRDFAQVVPRKRLSSSKRKRVAAALLRIIPVETSSVVQINSTMATQELVPLPEIPPSGGRANFPATVVESKQQKFRRRTWARWEQGYVTVQQQSWSALRVLGADLCDIHFAEQLRDIAVEFTSTPDCSDQSIYIEQQRAEGKLLKFDVHKLQTDEDFLLHHGLDALIESRSIQYPGLGFQDLLQFVDERGLKADKRERLLELLECGQQSFMLDTFTPNNCSTAVRNGVGYDSHRALCEHTAAKLYEESRCILVHEDFLVSHSMVSGLHVSPCNTVHKEGAIKRVVTDLSHGKDTISSYNHSVDLGKHLEAYPRKQLPTLRHVATLACQMKSENPGAGLLHGGIVDVRTAYQQYRLSVSKAKLVCTRLFSRRQIKGTDQNVAVIMIALTGTFGDVGAGDTYAILGDVFHELHNAVWALWRSVTYVDDMLILAPPYIARPHPSQLQHPFHACEGVFGGSAPGAPPVLEGTQYVIHQAVTYARNLVGNVLGKQATETRKTKWFYGCLVGIGWYFNLIYSEFYVLPKPEKLRKIVHYLFNVIPVGSEVAPYAAVRELQGLLCWFAAALPLGKSFVYSLFRCRPDKYGVVAFSSVAIRDLDFWRSLARCALIYPNLFGTKLENLKFGRRPSWFVRTDACTGHGGGGWLSKTVTWTPGAPDSRSFVLRWTKDELANINRWLITIPAPVTDEDIEKLQENLHHYCSDATATVQISDLDSLRVSNFSTMSGTGFDSPPTLGINVLEFTTAVFAVILWAPLMQGSCICLGADNTATLCWLVKHKTTNIASDTFLKLLSITCAVYNIQVVTEFIPGVRNVLADWLSRVSGGDRWDVAVEAAKLCSGSQGFFCEKLKTMADHPAGFSRRLISRTILMRSLTVAEPVAFQTLLAMILALKGEDDFSCDIADDRLKGTLHGIAKVLLSSPDGQLEVPMDFELAASQYYLHPTESCGYGETSSSTRSDFGPGYSSDNAGDGPHEGGLPSGWSAKRKSCRSLGKGWDSILTSDTQSGNETRDRLRASFPLLQSQAMASCHAPSTLRSYSSGWNSWSRYCDFFARSPLCEGPAMSSLPFKIIILQIQNYIHFECAVRQIQPDSIKNVYLAGIADYFDRYGILNTFREASNHNCVQLLLNSYSRSWKKKHPDSSRVKIAFGLSYAIHAERLIQSGDLTVGGCVCSDRTNLVSYMVGVRVITALWLGIFFLLRKNEFLPHTKVPADMQEPCRRRNLRFFDKRKMEIPYLQIGLLTAASVSLTLVFSKTDQTGHGRIVQHESTNDPRTCVVHRLEEYIRISRDYFHATVDSVLFSVPGLPTDLSSAVLTEVMRGTTTALGLPAASVSAHSLRYGGATALSQAGFPEYIIAFYGGWVNGSVAMRRYIVQSAPTRKLVSDHMATTAYATSVEELVRETLASRSSAETGSSPTVGAVSALDLCMGPAFSSLSRKRQRKN